MPLNEEAVLFGARRSLVGILSHPAEFDPARPAVLLLNAGLTHRAGPYRLYVKLARRLASLGWVVLRFDFSSIGDSLPREDNSPQNRANPLETREAMDYIEAAWGTRRFILMGICRGAWASFATACQDSRVFALVLVNPDTLADDRQSAISAQLKARTFVAGSLARGSSWRNVLRWPLRYGAQFGVLLSHLRSPLEHRARLSEADQVTARLRALISRGVKMLFVLSEEDQSRGYLAAILERHSGDLAEHIAVDVIPERGHIFMSLSSQRSLFECVERWVGRLTGEDIAAPKAGDIAGN